MELKRSSRIPPSVNVAVFSLSKMAKRLLLSYQTWVGKVQSVQEWWSSFYILIILYWRTHSNLSCFVIDSLSVLMFEFLSVSIWYSATNAYSTGWLSQLHRWQCAFRELTLNCFMKLIFLTILVIPALDVWFFFGFSLIFYILWTTFHHQTGRGTNCWIWSSRACCRWYSRCPFQGGQSVWCIFNCPV